MPDLYVYGEGHAKANFGRVPLSHVCLKVFNSAGDELSVSFDDSCGSFKHLQRVELCVFPKETPNTSSLCQYGIDAKHC